MGKVCISCEKESGYHSVYVWFEPDVKGGEQERMKVCNYHSFKENLMSAVIFKGYGAKSIYCDEDKKTGMFKITGLPEGPEVDLLGKYSGRSRIASASAMFWFCIPHREIFKTTIEAARIIFDPITSNTKINSPHESWCCGFNSSF
jgi:hypothetical protein